MRRSPLNVLVAVCLLLLVAVSPRPPHQAPAPVSLRSLAVGRSDFSSPVLAEYVKATELERFYAAAASQPVVVETGEGNTRAMRTQERRQEARYGTGACGGDLPPCSVMQCESKGNLTARNPRSTASGKWQILDSTWGGYAGYEHASDAPEEVQDARAREIYRGGAGRSAWVC